MTHIRPFYFDRDWQYIHNLTSAIATADTCGVVAEDEVGDPIGMVVFDSLTPNSAQAHIAMTNSFKAIRAGLLNAAFEFVFRVLDKGVLFGLVPECNAVALRFDKHMGFKEVQRLNDAYDVGIDYVVLEMRREACRWLAGEPLRTTEGAQLDLVKQAG